MALTVGVFLLLFGAGLWAFTRMGHRFAMVERGVGLVKKKRRIAFSVFFFNDTATTEIYTLSLHDALPIFWQCVFLIKRNLRRNLSYDDATTLDELWVISKQSDRSLYREWREPGHSFYNQIGRAHV